VTGALKNVAGTAFKSLIPGGSIGLQALSSLSGEAEEELSESSENNLEKWKNFVGFAENAYESLIDNFNESAIKNPIAANNLANQSLRNAMQKSRTRSSGHFTRPGGVSQRSGLSGTLHRRKKRYRLKEGDDIRIKGNKFVIRIQGL
jgi:hypothetical protein